MEHNLDPSAPDAEAGRSLWTEGQPGLHSKSQASPRNIETVSLGEQLPPLKSPMWTFLKCGLSY